MYLGRKEKQKNVLRKKNFKIPAIIEGMIMPLRQKGLVHWDHPEGWHGKGGGRRVQDGVSSKNMSSESAIYSLIVLVPGCIKAKHNRIRDWGFICEGARWGNRAGDTILPVRVLLPDWHWLS